MANTFTLAGTSLDAQNNAAYAGQYMTLRVTSVGTDTEDAASYPEKPVSFPIDSNGDWTSGADLWVNGDSGIESFYEMLEPSGQRIQFVFPSAVAGTTVRYEFALENYLVANAAAQLSPALAAHIADLNNPHVVTPAQLTLVIGTDTQAHSAVLDATTASFLIADETKLDGIEALADVTDTANVTAAGALMDSEVDADIKTLVLPANTTISTFGSTVVDDANAAAVRTTIGTVIGTDVQAHDADLDTIAALSPSQYDVMEYTGSVWAVKDGQISAQKFPIRVAADFPSPLVDGTQYDVHGNVDMGSVALLIPVAGNSISIMGVGPDASLTSSANSYTMFTDGANSGSVQIQNITITASGTSSKAVDLTNDGTGVFICSNTTFSNCTEIGTVNGHSFFSLLRSQDSGCTDGWTVDGTIISIDTNQCGSFGMASGGTTFKAGASLSVTSRVVFNGLFDTPTGATFCDFAAADIALDAGLEVVDCDFTGAGTFFSNINEKNVKSNWRGNAFPSIPPDNTHVGGGWLIASGGDEVINSTSPTSYAKVNGTTTPSDLQWFSGGTANDLELDSTRAVSITISGTIYFEGTNNATIQVKLVADDGTPADIRELGEAEFVGSNAPLNYSFADIPFVITSANTVIEVHAKSSSGNFTAKVHSYLQISARG